MTGQADDGWEEVTDPIELKRVGGAAAVREAIKANARRPVPSGTPADEVGGVLETAPNRDKARSGLAMIERIRPQLARVRKLQGSALGAQGFAGLAEYNPLSSTNQEYDAAVANLKTLVRPATRQPGEGSMSDFESKLAVATLPNRWKRDSYNREAIDGLQRLLDTTGDLYRTQLGYPANVAPSLPKVPPKSASRADRASALRRKYGLK